MNTVYTLLLLCTITVIIFWLFPNNQIERFDDICQIYNDSFKRAHPYVKDAIKKPFLKWCYAHRLEYRDFPTYRQSEKVYDALLRTEKY